jgi:CubicO group peptidase (beta-lactamase class C family)
MTVGAGMQRFEGPSDEPRRPLLTAAACLFVLVIGYLFSCVGTSEGTVPVRPITRLAPSDFPISTPEAQGMDSELLAEAIEFLLEERDLYNIHSLTIVRNGHIVADAYFYPYQPGPMHNLASTTKVFMTTLIGVAIDKGYLTSVDDRVVDYFPDRTIANLDDWKREMTIEDLLTMTSGLGFDDDQDTDDMEDSNDWVQAALDLPMSHRPGTWWNYHQPTAFLLSAILSEASGMNALDFARAHLFGPLGIVDAHWTASPNGNNSGYNELKLPPHDIAKLGQLFVQRGMWEGRRVISESWIDKATSILVGDFYGYMWNHYPDFPECYQGGGALGQRLVVSPSRDLVVVFTGGGYAHEDIERIYLEALDSYIHPSILSDGPLPPNPDGQGVLADSISLAASTDRQPHPIDPHPDIAAEISGAIYTIEPNAFELLTMSLTFAADDEASVRIISTGAVSQDSDFEWVVGLDGIERCGRAILGIPACGTGGWLNNEMFEMTIDTLGLFSLFRLTFIFESGGDEMSVVVEDLDWWEPDPTVTLTGTRGSSTKSQSKMHRIEIR